MDIRSDRQKGLSYVELGRKYHMDPRTAKRYAESPQEPEYTLSEPKPTKMDPYKQIVDEWLEEAPYSALRILEKLREMGFNGGYSIVKAYVSSRKMDLNEKATVRFETMPGKQGQMDCGFFEDHLVYEDGKWKKLYCFLIILNSVYTRSGQSSTPNSNATNLHSSQKRCCSFCISSSNASPTFQVQKSIFHQMTKPIQVTVILPLLLAISFSRNDDIHSSISGISNDLIGVISTIGQ